MLSFEVVHALPIVGCLAIFTNKYFREKNHLGIISSS
jgi:hypothetical protein